LPCSSGAAGWGFAFRAPSVTRRTLISWNPALGGGYRYANHFVGILSPMDCRGFRSKHVAFVDDFLSGEEVVAMQRHLLECERCAAHDAKIRRALLLFRNLPAVEPSSDFYSRLHARIESECAAAAARPTIAARGPGIGTFMSVAAGLVTIGYVTAASLNWTRPSEVGLSPVVATAPATPQLSVESQALVASMSAGTPVWPMVYLAEQAPMRFAQVQFTQTSLRR
jgi:anti-sigma factor RsiW